MAWTELTRRQHAREGARYASDLTDAERDGAPDVLKSVAARYPMLRHVFADGGYAGPNCATP